MSAPNEQATWIKPVDWSRFPRDFAVIQVGFALFGASIALLIRANLGTSSWAVLEVALSQMFGITPGTASVLTGFAILGLALALREPIGWGTLANILSIGPWEDLFLWIIPDLHENWPLQWLYLALALILMGLASAIYIGVNAGAGPRDSLMLAVMRLTKLSTQIVRSSIELLVVFVGWLLGGPVGVGTLIFAVLIGPAVQWGFWVFKMKK